MKNIRVSSFPTILVSLLLLVFPFTRASAQVGSGRITGTVFDPSGAVVPKAEVVITSVERGVDFRTQTTSSGLYEVGFLPPGRYTATTEVRGFKKSVKSDLVLLVGQTMRVDFNLEVGTIAQEVQVRGDVTQLLKPETSEVGQVINLRQVQDLPLNGRSFADLIPLNAGVTLGMQHAVNSGYNLNGSRTDMNMFMIEGVDNVDMNSNLLMSPSIDAIEEFQIQTGNFSAEYGRSAGGVVQVQLRSGANKYHGSLFEFVRNEKLDANGFFNNQVPPLLGQTQAPKQPLKRNQFGFSLGGPIKKDKLFFFGDFQGSRERQGTSAMFNVPSVLERAGDFSDILPAGQPIFKNGILALLGLPPALYPGCDLENFTPQTCQVIPTSGFDPAGANIAAMYPLPNVPGIRIEGQGFVNNYFATGSQAKDANTFDVKIDFRPREADSFAFRYSFQTANNVIPAAFGGGTMGPCIGCGNQSDALAGTNHARNQNGGLTFIHTFNPTTVNEFRAGLNRSSGFYQTSDGGRKLADEVGMPNVNVNDQTNGLPWFLSNTILTWTGTSPFEPSGNGYTVYQFTDNLAHFWGKHRIKVGVDVRRRLGNPFGNTFGRGAYLFGNFFTGVGFGDFLTGRGLMILQDLTPGTLGWRGIDYGAYIQDDIKVHPRLTLNIGMRYELFPGYVEVHNRVTNLDRGKGIAQLAGLNGNPRQFVPNDYNNFAPRFGFAWTPFANGKTVVRGGYGISYFNSGNALSYIGVNPPYTEAFTVPLNISFATFDALYRFSDGLPIQLRPTPATFDPTHPSGAWRQNDPLQRTPYSQYYSFGIQRALPWDLMVDVSYVGTHGVKLPGVNEGNPVPPGNPATASSRYIYYGTMPNVSAVNLYQNVYNSNYHSLQVKAVKRFSQGLQFLGSYTYGKSIDDKSGSAVTGGADSNPNAMPESPFNIRGERGRSSFDQTHRFTFAYNYDLPVGHGRKLGSNWHPVLDGFLGGWQINGILTFATGLPFSVFSSTLASCGCSATDMRADRIGNGNLPSSQRSINGWFDKTAFKDPQSYQVDPETGAVTLGQYGNGGRNIIYGPGLANLDFSVFKKFNIREKVELQLRGEFFNLFNRVNLDYPKNWTNAIWQTGGIITSTKPPRISQLALKLVF